MTDHTPDDCAWAHCYVGDTCCGCGWDVAEDEVSDG